MPKISVIIPAYNAMAYLPQTIESVLQQSFTDFEVLIVNDGSSDSIEEWATRLIDKRVKLICQPHSGVCVARNTGISEAKGEYIAFLDADDLWHSTKLEKQVNCLDSKPTVGLVYTWTGLIDESGKAIGRVWTSDVEGDVWKHIVVNDMISNGSSPMIRRACFNVVGVFDPNITSSEDRDMWTRIAAKYPFGVVKQVLTFYRRHPGNTTNKRQKMIQDLRQVIEKTFESVPLELLYLRGRSYGVMHLSQGWNSINEGNYQEAMSYRRQAFLHYPQLIFSDNFIRLSVAIAMTRYFGCGSYDGIRNITRRIKRLMVSIS